MKKPAILVANKDRKANSQLKNILKYKTPYETGIEFRVKTQDRREQIGNISNKQIFITGNLNPTSSEQRIARELKEKGAGCARILYTSIAKLSKEHEEHKKSAIFTNYIGYILEKHSKPLDVKDVQSDEFHTWFRTTYMGTFDDIILEGDTKNPLEKEVSNAIEYVRQKRLMIQPISLGIIGLGVLGQGIINQTADQGWVKEISVFSNFLNGNIDKYKEELARLDLSGTGERKLKYPYKNIEEIIEANPDVLIISTGEHGIDYNAYENDRSKLTPYLLKTSAPKVAQIYQAIINLKFPGLIIPETNPSGHLIHLGKKMNIPSNQMTSFTPDSIRGRGAIYNYLQQKNVNIEENKIEIPVVGEHMKGGTPLYDRATVDKKPLFEVYPEFKDPELQAQITSQIRGQGLRVMKSAQDSGHDYQGVPKRVKECLDSIAHLQKSPPYPIYAGILSLPANFTYLGAGNEIYPRVKRTIRMTKITDDKEIIKGLLEDKYKLREETAPYITKR